MNVKGIELRGDKAPGCVDSRSGVCLVLGSSPSVYADISEAVMILKNHQYDVMACNLSFLAWTGKLDHIVSLHQEKLQEFYELSKTIPVDRQSAYPLKHTQTDSANKDNVVWDIPDCNGTSSLFCVKIAHLMGYTKIILCGVSLEGNHRFYDNPFLKHDNNMGCDAILYSWNEYKWLPFKAMSGKPMQINGYPNEEWLNGYK